MAHRGWVPLLTATEPAVVALSIRAGSSGEEVLEASSLPCPGGGPVCPEHGAVSSVLLQVLSAGGSARRT